MRFGAKGSDRPRGLYTRAAQFLRTRRETGSRSRENHSSWTPRILSVFRIVVALLYLQHPLAKFFGFPHFAAFDNLQPFSLIWVAGVIELVGGLLLLVGLFTRPAAFILSGEMAVAYFMVRVPRGFSHYSPAARWRCSTVLRFSI